MYDAIGRVILIRESDSRNALIRTEGYVYDDRGRRMLAVDEEGRVTKYVYDNQSRLSIVLYPWTEEKAADRREAEEAGLYFAAGMGYGERHTYSAEEVAALRNILNRAAPLRGNIIAQAQMVWREAYAYDRKGNRASKTNPRGTIRSEYDAENRLVKKGDITIANDRDGNIISEMGTRYEARYEYDGRDRMAYSEATSHAGRTHTVTAYAYDALGRRTITESATGQIMRALYDGLGFEVIREGEAFRGGALLCIRLPKISTPATLVSRLGINCVETLTLYSRTGFDSFVIIMLDFLHICYQIGRFNQFRYGVPSCDNDFSFARLLP
jgi:YD repeat-containing protein